MGRNIALYVRRRHSLDEKNERVLLLPQYPERWNFEIPAGESEGDSGSWAYRKKVGGNQRGQIVVFEDEGSHGEGDWRREGGGGICSEKRTNWIRVGVMSTL